MNIDYQPYQLKEGSRFDRRKYRLRRGSQSRIAKYQLVKERPMTNEFYTVNSSDDLYEDADQSRSAFQRRPSNTPVGSVSAVNIKVEPDRVGLWGTIGSGKTTFLAVLYHVLNTEEWKLFGKGEESSRFIKEQEETFYGERQFPNPTLESGVYQYILEYTPLQQMTERRGFFGLRETTVNEIIQPKRFNLTFVDAPGEAFKYPEQWRARQPDMLQPLDELKRCEKIICLMDAEPFLSTEQYSGSAEDARKYFSSLFDLFTALRGDNTQITSHKFLFCVSKCDIPAIWEHRHNIAELAERTFDKRALGEIRRYVPSDRVSWHAFSAIGPFTDSGRHESPVVDGRIHPDHEIEPYGVIEMMQSLFLDD